MRKRAKKATTAKEDPYREALVGVGWEARGPALRRVFEDVSPDYDRLNTRLSFGLDRRWRAWAAASLSPVPPGPWLDLASGTGELAVSLRRCGAPAVIRADLSTSLLKTAAGKPGAGSFAVTCEMDRLPIRDASLAAVGQGFALRHCRDLDRFFSELLRVLAPGGRIAILDMRYPRGGAGALLHRLYFRWVLPRLAALLGGNRAAYEMMVESVRRLPPEESLMASLHRAGFGEVDSRPGIFGAVRLLRARRPD